MNKLFIKSTIILLILILLSACGDEENTSPIVSTNDTDSSEEVPENAVRLTISMYDGQQFINEQQVEIEEGANLLEVLDQTFYIETDENNELTSIERMKVSEEEDTSWHLFVNDELSDIPAKDYILSGGEKIVLDLQ
ncbi:DUF4430 domain-containing protein [Oceanobacillus luteolus]|uniref:DUF4430 domain-containing protein n=1 Tax=Oceanobacillus luteolus TaxID=1274358 RepID=A0ABW4HSQ5_9BACI|nr:DUF4430 domain-containing protein [Oceanobacillus luteolus]MCM3738831.1 DUF4430 domain-containing protein [Oceanobacillus luteolus]